MKNVSARFFLLIICLCVFVSATAAQEKPQVLEFAQINIKPEETENEILIKTLKKFISRLKKEPTTTRGFINIAGNSKTAEKIKSFVSDNSDLIDRIVFNWNLKYSENPISNIGFYIIPQEAEIPYVNVHEPVICPTLSIHALAETAIQNTIIIFTAKITGGEKDSITTYNWRISAGKIIEGQKTSVIKVGAESAKEITATVEIGGVDERCQPEVAFTTKIQQ